MFSDGTALFRAFLQREHAEENLDFILKVEKYKNMDSLQKRQKMAWDLYRDYIAVGAKHELNLDSMSRKVTTLAMITPHLTTFDTARGRIMNLLSNDAYLRFLSWEIYRELAAQASTSAPPPLPDPQPPPRSSTKNSLVSTSASLGEQRRSRPTSLTTQSRQQPAASKANTKKCQQDSIAMRELT